MAHEKRFWGLYDPNTDTWHFKGLTLKKRSLQIRLPKKHLASRTAELVVVLVAGMVLSALIASEYLGIGVGSIFISAGVILAGAIIAVAIYYILKSPVQKGVRGLRARRPFPPELKRELLEAQGGKCMYCGYKPRIGAMERKGLMEIDHKTPRSRDGSDDKSNLQVLCGSCNKRKRDLDDQEFRKKYKEAGVPQRVPRQKPFPPENPIPESKFEAVTKRR